MSRNPEIFSPQSETPNQDNLDQKQELLLKESELGDLSVEMEYNKPKKKARIRKFVVNDIRITNPEQEILSLSSLLPDDWKFVVNSRQSSRILYAHSNKKEISLPKYAKPINPYASKIECYSDKIISPSILERRGIFFSILHEIGHSHAAQLSAKERYLRRRSQQRECFLTEKELKQYREIVIKSERDAWAYALKKYRSLKRQGFDLFPQAQNN